MCSPTTKVRGFSLWATFILRSSSRNTRPFPNSSSFYAEPTSTSRLTCSSTSGLAGKMFVLRAGGRADRRARATPRDYLLGPKVTSSSSLGFLFTPTRRRLSSGLPVMATRLFANSGELIPICYTVLLLRSRKLSMISPNTQNLLQMLPSKSPSATLLVGGQKSRGTPTSRRFPREGSSMRRSLNSMV